MKQNNFYKGLMIMLTITMVGCNKDLLESPAYSQATSEIFWRNADDAVAAANSLYTLIGAHNVFGHAEQTWDITSDDQWRAGDHGEDQAIEEFSFEADNPQLNHSWALNMK